MAIYPCQFGTHRFPGRQSSIYGTLAAGSTTETRKARVCPEHFRAMELRAGETLELLDEDVQAPIGCQSCDGVVTHHVFLTFYPALNDPFYYVGDFCAAHADASLGSLAWHEWPLRAS